uniref:Uncharacterized protein n=1 Tax=Musa acuminata subsp. malaccensis TaxID=214687 RepID=A0A804IAY9_MUSAM
MRFIFLAVCLQKDLKSENARTINA